MTTWQDRKAVGDALEVRVTRELQQRGWDVAPYGQGTLPARIRTAISLGNYPLRHLFDLVASRGSDVVTIDCKDRMHSTETDRYAVAQDCVRFGLHQIAYGAPLFYVFGNLGVLTPVEVQMYGNPRAASTWRRVLPSECSACSSVR